MPQHDIVTAAMSPMQREVMYDCANRIGRAIGESRAAGDTRLIVIACLRVMAAYMARSAWGRATSTVEEMARLFPLYCNAAKQSNDSSRIIRPFSHLS